MIKKLITLFKLGRKVAKSDILEITSKFKRQALHAQQLKFLDPGGKNVDLAADAPDDFLNLQEQLFL